MRKGKNVIGQSVLSYNEGVRIHSVKDLLIGENNDAIVALLVDEGGLLSSSQVIPIDNVRSFGRDAVIVESNERVVSASSDPNVNAILHRQDKLLDKRVVTDEGRSMGSISDMYFDEGSGRIEGYEVSGGLLGDMANGTSFLPVNDIDRLGPDVVFVKPQTGEALDAQVGGIRGALNDAGDKINETADSARQGISDQQPEQRLVGRVSGRDVTDENGNIIVANGERVRPEHVEWAKNTDNLGTLTSAVAAGQAADAQRKAGQGLDAAGDSIASAWDRFVNKMGEMRDEQGRQQDAAQTAQRLGLIQDAIGRPVQKAILDKNDNLILDFGDIVTHKSIQLAYEAGMLDTLLGSVHRATVSFPNDQLKARQPAQATIDKSDGGAPVVEQLEQKVQQNQQQEQEQKERSRQESKQAYEQREREREQRSQQREQADQKAAASQQQWDQEQAAQQQQSGQQQWDQEQSSDESGAQAADQRQGYTGEDYSTATHYAGTDQVLVTGPAEGVSTEAGDLGDVTGE